MKPENSKDLSSWLSWMEACHPAEIELGLKRVRNVAANLALDFSESTVVTVGGTNGKGSTISYLRNIYQHAGYSVGCFTSPHFIAYNERVQINGQNVSDQQLCDAFSRIDQAREEIPLTYFEFGTLAALVIFSQRQPDLILLEVGLGGRLDAVNIIDADVSVVTTIALDHIEWLGDNREDIGFEKAGIFRSAHPAICGDLNPPTSVASFAQEIDASLYQAGRDFEVEQFEESWRWNGVSQAGDKRSLDNIPYPQLPLQNASTAIQTVQCIPLDVTDEQIKSGLKEATLTGRMQHIERDGTHFYLDVAHNPEAAEHLSKRLASLQGTSWLILGMLVDKDCQAVMNTLVSDFEKIILVTLDVSRGQSAEQLSKLMPEHQCFTKVETMAEALNSIKTANLPPDNVIIAGSFFTVANALCEMDMDQA